MNNNLNNNEQSSNNVNPMTGTENNMATPEVPVQPNLNQMPQNNTNNEANGQTLKKTINKNTTIIIAAVIVIIAIIILFASGIIGGKTLTCTTEDTSMGMTMKQELKINFKRDKVNKIVGRMSIDYGDNIEYKDEVEESLKDELENLKEDEIDAKIESGKNSTTLVITAEKNKLKDAFGLYEDDGDSYEEIKEYFEEEDYTCK